MIVRSLGGIELAKLGDSRRLKPGMDLIPQAIFAVRVNMLGKVLELNEPSLRE